MSAPPPRPLPGGPLAIDLLNTAWWPGGQPFDWLDDDVAVCTFSESYGVEVAPGEVDPTRSALIEARQLIQRLLHAATTGAIDAEIMAEVDAALASTTATLTASPHGLRLSISSDDTTRALAVDALVDAIELLHDQPDRIRSCHHDQCTLWFVDTSKAGRRRWCTMERCGNRAKAQRHYDRSREARQAEAGGGTGPAAAIRTAPRRPPSR